MFKFIPDSIVHADKGAPKVGELMMPSEEHAELSEAMLAIWSLTGLFHRADWCHLVPSLFREGTVTSQTVTFQQMCIDYTLSPGGTVPTMPGVYLYTCSLTDPLLQLHLSQAKLPCLESGLHGLRQTKSRGLWSVVCYSEACILLHFTGNTRNCGPSHM